jgi:hypothetical protein
MRVRPARAIEATMNTAQTFSLRLALVAAVVALASAGAHAAPAPQLDPTFTPGKLCTPSSPDFVAYRYREHIPICRPHLTPEMKREIAVHYGVPQSQLGGYEFDYLIPLGLGGASNVDNVWIRPRGAANTALEAELEREMQAGTITQAQALQRLAHPSFDGTYTGSFEGGSQGSIRFVVKDEAVTGTISGVCTAPPCTRDPMQGSFTGSVSQDGAITTRLAGTLTDSSGSLGSFRFTGAVDGAIEGDHASGSWNGRNAFGNLDRPPLTGGGAALARGLAPRAGSVEVARWGCRNSSPPISTARCCAQTARSARAPAPRSPPRRPLACRWCWSPRGRRGSFARWPRRQGSPAPWSARTGPSSTTWGATS